MPTTAYTEYYPYVEPFVPGCPEVVIATHIAEAANKFCRETYLWRTPLSATNTVADTQDYSLTPPADTVVFDVQKVELERVPLTRTLDRMMPLNYSDESSRPTYFSYVEPNVLRFYPIPDRVYSFRGSMIVKPTLTATGAETFLYEQHGRCIAAGALAKLFSLPDKPWTSPELAMYYKQYYSKAVADARIYDTRSVQKHVRQIPFA